jgi:hypothetical protein
MNNKPLFYLILFFSFINLVDLFTSMFILDGESNPLFLLFGTPIVLYILKFALIGMVWIFFKHNEYPSRFWYFTFIYILVIGSLLMTFGAASNIYGMINPQVIESAAELSTPMKLSYYSSFVFYLMILPYFISVLAFKLFISTENNVRYNKKNVL